MGPGREEVRQLGQEQAHRHGQTSGMASATPASRSGTAAEQVGRGEALLMKTARTHALLVPDVGEAPF